MSSSSGKSLELGDPSTNYACKKSSNVRIREENYESEKLLITELIKRIEHRLSILEEEYEVLKEGALRSMAERTILMDEIFKEFQVTHHHLRLSNQERNYYSFDEVLASIQALKKERRPGHLQVFVARVRSIANLQICKSASSSSTRSSQICTLVVDRINQFARESNNIVQYWERLGSWDTAI